MNSNNNINNYDLLFLSNKELYNKFLEKKERTHVNIIEDVVKYKKEIKTKINKLLDAYLDDNNDMDKLLKSKNDSEKYKYLFYNFLVSLIENIKLQEIKKSISKDLSGVKNEFSLNVEDICNNLMSIDMNLAEENNNIVKKITNLNDFVNVKNRVYKPKILPRSQDAKPIVMETTGLYGIRKKTLKKHKCRIGQKPYFFEVSKKESLDLDTKEDFKILKTYL